MAKKVALIGLAVMLGGCVATRSRGVASFVVLASDEQVQEAVRNSDRLQDVKLVGTEVTDDSLIMLGDVEELRRLWVMDTSITDAGLRGLQGHTNMTVLYLAGEGIGDEGIRNLGVLPSLLALEVSETKVTNQMIGYLLQFPSLELVQIDRTAVDQKVLDEAFRQRQHGPFVLESLPAFDELDVDH